MDYFMVHMVIILLLIVILGYFNEKVTKFTYEIALMLFSICVGGLLLFVAMLTVGRIETIQIFRNVEFINLDDYLVTKGILCFMLFAGCSHMNLINFEKHARAISLLAIGATFLGAVFYGAVFYGAGLLLG